MATRGNARSRRLLWTTGLLSVSLLASPAVPALAAPHPSAQQLHSKLSKLQIKSDHVVDDFNQARVDVHKAHGSYKKLNKKVKKDAKRVTRMRGRIAMMASVAYQSGNMTSPASMFASGDPNTALDRMASLNHLSASQTASIKRFLHSDAKLRANRKSAKSKLSKAKKALSTQRTKRGQVKKLIKKQKHLLSQLPPSQKSNSSSGSGSGSGSNSSSPGNTGGSYTGSASGSARAALNFAFAQRGKPYQFGAAGPSAYDCSGLTMAAWKAAGVTIPRTSQAQYNSGQHVSKSQLQPGDLVFFNGLSHVGMYTGNGNVIHAPHTGSVVNVLPLSAMASGYVGAVRP